MVNGNTIKLIKNDNGTIREWCASVKQTPEGYGVVTFEWGTRSGKKQTKVDTFKIGKNIGKSNETTPYKQAVAEMISDSNRKKDKGYYVEGEKIKETIPLPMLAYQYEKHKDKIKGTIFVQPKYDGIRCVGWQRAS
jgi:hypothetical protein